MAAQLSPAIVIGLTCSSRFGVTPARGWVRLTMRRKYDGEHGADPARRHEHQEQATREVRRGLEGAEQREHLRQEPGQPWQPDAGQHGHRQQRREVRRDGQHPATDTIMSVVP